MGRRGGRAGWAVLLVGIGLLAFGVRFGMMWRSGLLDVGGYDDGVHYAIAVNLVHGRLPYRDVLFLQPPGIALAASPFAALAPVLGDPRAFVLAKIAFAGVGALNAVVTAAVLRRFGLSAALVGGVLYAVAFTVVYDERTLTLEPIGTLGVLTSLLLLPRAQRLGGRWAVLAGVAAGSAVGFKIWYAVALVVLLAAVRGGRLRFLAGAAAAGLVVYLPFFAAAPARMWEQVVLAQLGRPDLGDTPLEVRLASLLGVSGLAGDTSLRGVPPDALVRVLGGVAVLVVLVALIDRRSRVFGVLTVADLTVLLASPSYFAHYAILVAQPLVLCAGAVTAIVLRRVPVAPVRIAVVALLLLAVVQLNLLHDGGRSGRRPPLRALQAAATAVRGCVVSDAPAILAGMNTLTRDVAAGCDIHADPSGISYVHARFLIDGKPVDRDRNPVFQREITRYLRSGSAHVVVRPGALLLDRRYTTELAQGTPLVDRDGFRLYPD